ncbi:MAG: hypothetical protein ACRD3E_21005 [Terriglobales bacterium]
MAGYIKILRTDLATGTHGQTMESYRLSYVTGGDAWVRDFDFDGLQNFLISNVGLTPARTTDVMNQARLHGTSTVPAVDFPENDALQSGMTQLPSDEG